MALKRNERYPGRFSNPTTSHPQGGFKNRSAPSAQDGSYLEQDWANDWDGFFGRLLTVAGITANGNVDTALSSQYYDALSAAMTGRLVNIQIFTSSGTYTPSPGTKKIIIEAVGGGGGGGGVPVTTSGQSAVATGGMSGDYVRTPPLTAQTLSVTVGSGGSGGTGSDFGVAGGKTTVGSVISLRGGPGGGGGSATTTPIVSLNTTAPVGSLVAPINSIRAEMSLGVRGFVVSAGIASTTFTGGAVSGSGGSSPLGRGGDGTGVLGSDGANANGYGSGGAGAINVGGGSGGVVRTGGNGSNGIVIITELS